MANTVYVTAGLPVAKNSGQSPTSQVNTVFASAGLPPIVLASVGEQNPQLVDGGLVNRGLVSGGLVA